jgi:hypothetical protein
MAIHFYTQSKNSPAIIYIRVRQGRNIDLKAKTQLQIDPEYLVKGNVIKKKLPRNADAVTKKITAEDNIILNSIANELNSIHERVLQGLNNANFDELSSDWLKEVVNPTIEESKYPLNLTEYFEYWLNVKQSTLRQSTYKRLNTTKNRIKKFEKDFYTIPLAKVNRRFSMDFQQWGQKQGYANNTIVKTLKDVKTVCKHARINEVEVHKDFDLITHELKYNKTEHIYLNFDELKQIEDLEIEDSRLDSARDWLLISCFTAQRVSDFLRFTKDKVKKVNDTLYLDIRQQKTESSIDIPLTRVPIEILNKRSGEFPPIFSENADSNKAIYNKLIKEVCRLAKINEEISTYKRNSKTNRYEHIIVPKYKAVSSHIGRRSFATNFYGKIKTSLLIVATGHASEHQFLEYIQKKGDNRAEELANEFNKLGF